jgi:hypothetical protein
MKNAVAIFAALATLFSSIFFVIPSLSTNVNNYKSTTKVLRFTRMDKQERLLKPTVYTLNLIMEDSTEWKITDQHSKHFDRLSDPKNVGKSYKMYLAEHRMEYYNPEQIEIDGEVIYTPESTMIWKYLILFLTFIFTINAVFIIKDLITLYKNKSSD